MVQEIDFVRQTAPAGQFPVRNVCLLCMIFQEEKRKSAITAG